MFIRFPIHLKFDKKNDIMLLYDFSILFNILIYETFKTTPHKDCAADVSIYLVKICSEVLNRSQE